MKAVKKSFVPRLIRLSKSVWALPVILSILKLWLTSHLPIMASYGVHDNLKYIQMASEIFDFAPPFPYDQLTLIRQPGYPFFIRLSYILGFSLRFSQELLYISSGFFLAWSLYKYYHQKIVTVVFLSIYTLAPASFFWNRETIQEALYLPLTTFIISCLIHLVNSYADRSKFFGWSIALGLILAWFWNIRPEGVLICLVIFFAYILIAVKAAHFQRGVRWSLKQIGYSLACLVIPVVFVTSSISLTNYLKYGIFHTNDLTSAGLKSAYSRILKVSPDRWRYMVPVPKQTRFEIYYASPTFAKLYSFLESEQAKAWWGTGCQIYSICDDYTGGWFVWALRDAVAIAGEYKSAPSTEAFYKQIAYEVETACKSGNLKCKETLFSLSSFAPTIRSEDVNLFFISLDKLAHVLVDETVAIHSYSLGSGEEDLKLREKYYERITRESSNFIKQRNKPFNQLKDNLITFISKIYKFLFPPLLGLATLGLLLRHLTALRYRAQATGVPLSITWMMLLCIMSRIILMSYIDATSFPGGFRYLWSIVPLMLMVVAVGVSYLIETLSLTRRLIVR